MAAFAPIRPCVDGVWQMGRDRSPGVHGLLVARGLARAEDSDATARLSGRVRLRPTASRWPGRWWRSSTARTLPRAP